MTAHRARAVGTPLRRLAVTLLAIPTIAALPTLHGMVPPHPGPLVAVDGLHADLVRCRISSAS